MELGSGLRPWRRFCAEAVDATETDASVSPPRLRRSNSSVPAGDAAAAAKSAADGDGGVGGAGGATRGRAFGFAFGFGAGVGMVVIVVSGSSVGTPKPVTSSVRCV